MKADYLFRAFLKLIYRLFFCIILFFLFSVQYSQSQEKKAIIRLQFSEDGVKKYITAKVNEFENDSIGDPVSEIDLNFYVERTFSLLPIGDFFNTTEENGEVKIEFPSDLPGDSVGNVKIIVKIVEADEYADTEVQKTINWGIVTSLSNKQAKRSLWAAGANAPISLLLLTNILILTVWGIIVYIIFKLVQISKL
jgi:hypothetical protein